MEAQQLFKNYMNDISFYVEKFNEDYQIETDIQIKNAEFKLRLVLELIEKAVDDNEEHFRQYILNNIKEKNLNAEKEMAIHFKEKDILHRKENDRDEICRYIDWAMYIRNLMDAILRNDKLYFAFGKYKGRIVQDIYKRDEAYCKWFMNNVQGKNLNDLKIIDYINKKDRNKAYCISDPIKLYNKIIKEYNLSQYEEYINKDEILSTYINDYYKNKETNCAELNKTTCCESHTKGNFYDGQENSAFWNSMIDVEDIVDECDLC